MNKKIKIRMCVYTLLFLLFSIVFNVSYALASPFVNISITLNRDVVYPGEIINGIISLKSPNNIKGYIDIYALGRESWFSWEKDIISINKSKRCMKHLNIKIPNKVKGGRYYFYVYFKDAYTKKVIGEKKKSIYILERPLLSIKSIGVRYKTIKPGEKQIIYITIKNIGELDAKNYYLIVKSKQISLYHKYMLNVKSGEETTIISDINIHKKSPPGVRKVVVELYDDRNMMIDSKEYTFNVEPIDKVYENITSKATLFYKDIYVKVRNIGNVPTNYTYAIGTSNFMWLYDFSPISPIKVKNKYAIICRLNVGEECNFRIRVNYWLIYVIILILMTLIILIFISFTSPKVVKEYYVKGHRYTIILKITNHKTKELRDVILKDYIKGIFVLDEDTILPKPSKISKNKDKYLIEWRLGTLKPNETRVFRYEIIPKVSVIGDLKLENAKLEGKDKKGKKYTISS